MKLNLLHRIALAAVLFVISLLAAPAFGALVFALPAAAFLNVNPAPLVLGVSYPRISPTTVSGLLTDTAAVREQLWVKRVLLSSAEGLYQDAPLADEGAFIGRLMPGDKLSNRVLMKAIVEMVDTSKVAGNTIDIPTMTGFGGPIVVGEGDRIGGEQKIHQGNFQLQIGRGWYGGGWTSIARDETVLGSGFDRMLGDHLRKQVAKKKNDDHLMRLRTAAASGIGLNNAMLPEGVTSAAAIKTANVLDTTLISNMGDYLPSLGGLPMTTANDSGGSLGEMFTIFATDRALNPLNSEPAYLEGQKTAGVRGDDNRIFKGGFSMWNGHGIYRWINRDHANKGPLGSPLLPRARLGVALTGANTADIVTGGGLVYSSTETPLPQYFEFFTGAFYQYANGQTIARESTNTKYLMIINNDGTGYAVYSYKVVGTGASDASQITIFARVSIGVGTETNTHPQGSLIVECDVLGVPIGTTLMLGAEALVCGYGSIDGNLQKMGRRTEEHRNHDMEHAFGVEFAWGNNVVSRAGDGAYPNFLVAKHAIPVPGAPTIS